MFNFNISSTSLMVTGHRFGAIEGRVRPRIERGEPMIVARPVRRLPAICASASRRLGDDVFEVLRNRSSTKLGTICLRPPHLVVVLISPNDPPSKPSPAERKRRRSESTSATGLVPSWRKKSSSAAIRVPVYDWWSSTSDGPDSRELTIWHEMYKRLCLVSIDTGREQPVTEDSGCSAGYKGHGPRAWRSTTPAVGL